MSKQYLVALITNAIPYIALQIIFCDDNYIFTLFDSSILVLVLVYFYTKMNTMTKRIVYVIGCFVVNVCCYFICSKLISNNYPDYKDQMYYLFELFLIFVTGFYATLSLIVSIGVTKLMKQK